MFVLGGREFSVFTAVARLVEHTVLFTLVKLSLSSYCFSNNGGQLAILRQISSLVMGRPSDTLSLLRDVSGASALLQTSETCCTLLLARTGSGGCVGRAASSIVRGMISCCSSKGGSILQVGTRCCLTQICRSVSDMSTSINRFLVTLRLTRNIGSSSFVYLSTTGLKRFLGRRSLPSRTSSCCRETRRITLSGESSLC